MFAYLGIHCFSHRGVLTHVVVPSRSGQLVLAVRVHQLTPQPYAGRLRAICLGAVAADARRGGHAALPRRRRRQRHGRDGLGRGRERLERGRERLGLSDSSEDDDDDDDDEQEMEIDPEFSMLWGFAAADPRTSFVLGMPCPANPGLSVHPP